MINEEFELLIKSLNDSNKALLSRLEALEVIINKQREADEETNKAAKKIVTEYNEKFANLDCKIDDLIKLENTAISNTKEAIWADVFHDTIINSVWLKDKSFAPGRWAIGYEFLYVLYRILSETNSVSILEFGLGESTKMITQYAESSEICKHTIIEHDTTWIEKFKNKNFLSANSSICHLELSKTTWKEDNEIICYDGFEEKFKNEKFDFICIDGPFGHMAKKYARVDILSLLPGCLKDSFVIIIDDYHRFGEQNLAKEIEEIFQFNNINYASGRYFGVKGSIIFTSIDYSFCRSL